jgi:hypothetical protein
MQITKEELGILRKNLPHGACARVAKKFGCHRNNIYNVLNGSNKNQKIINELIAESLASSKHEEKVKSILKQLSGANED